MKIAMLARNPKLYSHQRLVEAALAKPERFLHAGHGQRVGRGQRGRRASNGDVGPGDVHHDRDRQRRDDGRHRRAGGVLVPAARVRRNSA